ncbi:MFS transporter [Streptomyces sp. NPDC005483]|uniref:MFS transporter n=1 Tax=Streptomyces sp. NPDC005483 TaxID=3154882 RepID=UPI0033A1AFA7
MGISVRKRTEGGETIPRPSRPQQILLFALLINATGSGLYVASAPVYLTREVGLSDYQAGLGFTIGSGIALALMAHFGYLCDRIGAKRTYVLSCLFYAVAMVAFTTIDDMLGFTVVATATGITSGASAVARPALVRQMSEGHLRWFRTRNRVVNNLGMALGAGGAIAALKVDTSSAFEVIYLANAASFVICAAFVMLATRSAGGVVEARPSSRKWVAVRDRQFIRGTVLNGIIALQYPLLTFAMPLWAIDRIGAPAWVASGYVLLNTVSIVVIQSRLSRGIRSLPLAGRAMRRSGLIFTVNVVLVALSPLLPTALAAVILVLSVLVHSVGEALHAGASQEVYYGMATNESQAEYAGVFWIGQGLALTVGPVLLAYVCLGMGIPGWLVLGAVFLVTGLLSPRILMAGAGRPVETAASVEEPASHTEVTGTRVQAETAPEGMTA